MLKVAAGVLVATGVLALSWRYPKPMLGIGGVGLATALSAPYALTYGLKSESFETTPIRHFSLKEKLDPRFWVGNADEPNAPSWYLPDVLNRDLKYHWRNPLHNFTFYVIGTADQQFTRRGLHPKDTFNPNDGFNWAVSEVGSWRYLLYPRDASYRRFGCDGHGRTPTHACAGHQEITMRVCNGLREPGVHSFE